MLPLIQYHKNKRVAQVASTGRGLRISVLDLVEQIRSHSVSREGGKRKESLGCLVLFRVMSRKVLLRETWFNEREDQKLLFWFLINRSHPLKMGQG